MEQTAPYDSPSDEKKVRKLKKAQRGKLERGRTGGRGRKDGGGMNVNKNEKEIEWKQNL